MYTKRELLFPLPLQRIELRIKEVEEKERVFYSVQIMYSVPQYTNIAVFISLGFPLSLSQQL